MKPFLVVIVLAACKNPAPQCAPSGTPYTTCSDWGVWECPAGDSAAVAANQALTDACQTATDPIQCVMDAQYTYVDMTLQQDCKVTSQQCVEDYLATPSVATCQDPSDTADTDAP